MKLTTNTSNILNNLSFSESNAIKAVARELDGSKEKLIVVSDIADGNKITRSVCTNALRIIEACGVIVTKSLGMKGLHIKILNQEAFAELVK